MCVYVLYIYIYIYICREREREIHINTCCKLQSCRARASVEGFTDSARASGRLQKSNAPSCEVCSEGSPSIVRDVLA